MGVKGFLKFIEPIQQRALLTDFRGKVIGVDASVWLHRGCITCAYELATGKDSNKYVDYVLKQCNILLSMGVEPLLVFDGNSLPSKSLTNKLRSASRLEAKALAHKHFALGNFELAERAFQQTITITSQMSKKVINKLVQNNIKFVVSPYEADAQLAYLEKKGYIQAVLSEDSDYLIFGVKCLITKFNKDSYECRVIWRSKFDQLTTYNLGPFSDSNLRLLAAFSGCDYTKGIPSIGLIKAYKFIQQHNSIEASLNEIKKLKHKKLLNVCFDELEKEIRQAVTTFKYQRIFDPESNTCKCLNDLEIELDQEMDNYIGPDLSPQIAQNVAYGVCDPKTKELYEQSSEIDLISHGIKSFQSLNRKFITENDIQHTNTLQSGFPLAANSTLQSWVRAPSVSSTENTSSSSNSINNNRTIISPNSFKSPVSPILQRIKKFEQVDLFNDENLNPNDHISRTSKFFNSFDKTSDNKTRIDHNYENGSHYSSEADLQVDASFLKKFANKDTNYSNQVIFNKNYPGHKNINSKNNNKTNNNDKNETYRLRNLSDFYNQNAFSIDEESILENDIEDLSPILQNKYSKSIDFDNNQEDDQDEVFSSPTLRAAFISNESEINDTEINSISLEFKDKIEDEDESSFYYSSNITQKINSLRKTFSAPSPILSYSNSNDLNNVTPVRRNNRIPLTPLTNSSLNKTPVAGPSPTIYTPTYNKMNFSSGSQSRSIKSKSFTRLAREKTLMSPISRPMEKKPRLGANKSIDFSKFKYDGK